jgi:hypothetical protein
VVEMSTSEGVAASLKFRFCGGSWNVVAFHHDDVLVLVRRTGDSWVLRPSCVRPKARTLKDFWEDDSVRTNQ